MASAEKIQDQPITDSDRNEVPKPFQLIHGIRWVSDWDSDNLEFALSYQVHPDDLFIVTYPRSGTTWMQNIVYILQNNGQPFTADSHRYFDQNPHLEMDGEIGIENMQRPGAIKTHLPMGRVPYHPSAKYICVVRNPKDVCVSYYLFYNMWPEVPKLQFDQFVDYFIQGCLPFNDCFDALRSAWQWSKRDNVLLVCYEDIRTNMPAAITQVANFIGVALTDQLLDSVGRYSSFTYMKDHFDQERRLVESTIIDTIQDNVASERRKQIFQEEADLKVVRKGVINDWKSFMTAEQSHRIDERFKAICQECEGLKDYWTRWNVFEYY